MKIAIAILGSLVLCTQSWAHHSFADYDRSVIREMEGELLEVRWRNPHVTFTVRVVEPNGEALDWVLETGALYLLERAGLEEAMFPVNERVRVAGWASTTRPGRMNVSNMLLPAGEEVVFNGRRRYAVDWRIRRGRNGPPRLSTAGIGVCSASGAWRTWGRTVGQTG